MISKKHTLSVAIASALAFAGYAQTSLAQEAAEPDSPRANTQRNLEEITVTAQKRTQTLLDVPVAVTVLDSQAIDNTFSQSLESIQQLAPSVNFRKGNTTRNSALTVRGIGTISFSTAAEPSVSTVVDGVVLGRSGQAFTQLYDVEQIEILRGPQGTLFGKNASAGVVNITTKRPGYEVRGMVEATAFNDEEYTTIARIEGGITDSVAASLTVLDSQYEGNLTNVHTNETVNGHDKEGFRIMVNAEASPNTEVLAIFENVESDDDCCADIEGLPSGRNPDSEAAPDSEGIVNGEADLDLDQRLVDHDLTTRTIDETTAFSVQVDHSFGDYTLTSISAWRDWDNTEIREGDFTSIAGDDAEPVFGVPFQLHDVGPQAWRQLSQEIRLSSPDGNRLFWQVGAFYWDQESERSFTREASCQNNAGQLNADIGFHLETVEGVENPTQEQIDDFIDEEGITCLANDIVSATAYFNTQIESLAFFGDGTFDVTDRFRLLFGARWTDDEVSFNHNRFNNDVYGRTGVGVRSARDETNFDNDTSNTDLSGRAGLQYDLTDNSMAYFTYSRGYKGPAFNVFFNMSESAIPPIEEETSDAFELGFKYTSGSLIFNAAAFLTQIEGFQANNLDNSTGVNITRLTNAGDVETSGVEADITWNATDALTLSGGFALVNAEIDEFNCPRDTPPEACTDRSGLDVPYAPDLKYSVTANYVWNFDNMDIIWNTTFNYTDDVVGALPSNDGTVNPAVELPDYGLLDSSVAFSFKDDAYRLSLIAKNITDDSFFTAFSGDNFRFQVPKDADRRFGVQFRARF